MRPGRMPPGNGVREATTTVQASPFRDKSSPQVARNTPPRPDLAGSVRPRNPSPALLLATVIAITLVSLRAHGDPPQRFAHEGPVPASSPRDPNAKVAFTLEDADINELVRVVGEITGRHFIVASGKAKGIKATVYSPEKVTVAAAYQAFLSILQANGLTVLPQGAFDAIVDSQDVARQATPVQKRGDERAPALEYVTRIHHLAHVDATEVATNVLSKFETQAGSIVPYAPNNLLILTDTAENVVRMMHILEEIDVGGPHEQVYFQPLFYVPARDLEKTLGVVFDVKTSDGPRANDPPLAATHEGRVTKIVAVDRPNALVIVGTQASYLRLLELIRRIDVPSPEEQEMHVVPLLYSDAKKIVGPINEAITGGTPTSSGAPVGANSSASAPSPARPVTVTAAGAIPVASALSGPTRVSAEDSTNSLVVTASLRDFATIREVIRELDQPKRQVYIDAVVMDLSTQRAEALGLAYHVAAPTAAGSLAYGGLNPLTSIQAPTDPSVLQGFALGLRGPSTGQTLTLPTGTGITIPAFGILLSAMMTTDDADVLQTPHILATDNTAAEIKVQLHTALSSTPTFQSAAGAGLAAGSAAAGAAAVNPFAGTYSTPYGQIGPDIKITPHINGSDEVRLDIDEEISDLLAAPPAGALSSSTSVSYTERDATTTLTVKDQETIVIGGLVHDKVERTVQKIPFLGDIPVLGTLFRSTNDTVEKDNLILVLTPYIIREPADLRRIFERKMAERQEFIDREAVFGGHGYSPARDFTRRQGLLGEIRAAYEEIATRQREEDALAPKGPLDHAAVEPIELPAPVRGDARPPTAPASTPSRPAPGGVTRATTVER
jgi:general secretion pathway protein D